MSDSKLDWKKFAEKPSGPGALFGWMEKRASLISEAEGMEISMSFVACDTEGCIARDITSEQSEVDAVKILWKYPIIVSTIFALSKTSAPVPSSITARSSFLLRSEIKISFAT